MFGFNFVSDELDQTELKYFNGFNRINIFVNVNIVRASEARAAHSIKF